MRIGLILDDTLDSPDGVQQYVLNVGEWLTSAGHEVHYLVGQTKRHDIANIHSLSKNIAVLFNGNRLSVPLPASKKHLKQLLLQYNFDVLHVQVPYSPFLAGRLLSLAPQRTAIVGTFHILPYSRSVHMANRVLSVINHKSGKRFQAMIAVSPPAARFATKMYGYKTKVIPNPVRLAQFTGADSTGDMIRIVYLGRLVQRKGVSYLLEALAQLQQQKRLPSTICVDIGGKGVLLERLQKFVVDNQLSNIVHFRGFIPEKEKAAFLASADIAVFPSTGGESFGIVLLEAMACIRGVVLAGDNPGYRSVMEGRANQLIWPVDSTAFAERIAWWLEHPKERLLVAKWQQKYVQTFDVNYVGERIVAVYTAALLQSSTRA